MSRAARTVMAWDHSTVRAMKTATPCHHGATSDEMKHLLRFPNDLP